MDKGQKSAVGVVVGIVLLVILSIAFTIDDVTVIGELLDPVEFAGMGVMGAAWPSIMKMFTK